MLISAIFVNNILLPSTWQLPVPGCSKERAGLRHGLPVVFVVVMATAFTWLMQKYVLDPFGLGYLQTLAFILVIAALVQFVEMFLKKMVPPLYKALGIFLPLITTNCAVLGIAILVQRKEFGLGISLYYSFVASLGFPLALMLMAGIRERLAITRLPQSWSWPGSCP